MQIIWSAGATSSLEKIRLHIRHHFTEKEELVFVKQVLKTISSITKFPKGYPECKKPKHARKAVIHPHSTLFYRVKSKHRIECLLFWAIVIIQLN